MAVSGARAFVELAGRSISTRVGSVRYLVTLFVSSNFVKSQAKGLSPRLPNLNSGRGLPVELPLKRIRAI